jgi:hypothetical protein
MNTGDTLALAAAVNAQVGDAPTKGLRHADLLTHGLANSCETGSTERLTEPKHSSVRVYATRTSANLRSIVERRFKRMSEAHDRIRTKLLAAHLSQMK